MVRKGEFTAKQQIGVYYIGKIIVKARHLGYDAACNPYLKG